MKALRAISVAAPVAIAVWAVTGAVAQTMWNLGNDDGNWNVAANWNPPAVPTATTDVILGDVTGNGSSGTPVRTVTVSDARVARTVTLNQTTAGFENRLFIGSGGGLTFNQGTSTIFDISAGSHLDFQGRGSSFGGVSLNAGGTYTIANAGQITLRNAGAIRIIQTSNTPIIVNNSGMLTVSTTDASANVAVIGATDTGDVARRTTVTLDNTGTVSVTGRLALGTLNDSTTLGNQGVTARVLNRAGGQFAIGDSSRVLVYARSRTDHDGRAEFITENGSITTIGNTGAGLLLLRHLTHLSGYSGTLHPRVLNAGTMTINGNSLVAMEAATVGYDNFEFTNQATGVLNITGNGSIGGTATTKNVLFANAGTLNKTGSGTAEIRSATAGSSATNTGTMNIQSGTLHFLATNPLTNSGNITGNGTLKSSGINSTAGNFSPGNSIGTLTLALNNVTDTIHFGANTSFTFELDAPDGVAGVDNDLIAFTGLNTSGTNVTFNNNTLNIVQLPNFGLGNYTLFTFDQPGRYTGNLTVTGLGSYGGYLTYNPSDIVLTVIPEPGSVAVLTVGSAMLLIRRRIRREQ